MRRKRRTSKTTGDYGEASGPLSGVWVGVITLALGLLIAGYLFFTNQDPKSFEAYHFINTGLCLWLPLIVIFFVFREEPTEFGLTRGDSRFGLRWALVAWIAMVLPVAFYAHLPAAREFYLQGRLENWSLAGLGPVFDGTRVNFKALVYYELAVGFYMFCWEFFFRGFLLFGLARSRLGAVGAVIAQAIIFMLLHWAWKNNAAKPSLEVLSALPGGLILGTFALRTRSSLYGFITHWAISVTLDLFLLFPFTFR